MNIVTASDRWTQSQNKDNQLFRFCPDRPRLYRKTIDPALYAGYQIHYCHIDSKLAKEWIKDNFS